MSKVDEGTFHMVEKLFIVVQLSYVHCHYVSCQMLYVLIGCFGISCMIEFKMVSRIFV